MLRYLFLEVFGLSLTAPALSANERIAEFFDFAIQAKFSYVNKLGGDCITADLLLMMIEVDFTACYNTNQNSPA